jgi:hypothetical protein
MPKNQQEISKRAGAVKKVKTKWQVRTMENTEWGHCESKLHLGKWLVCRGQCFLLL